MKNVEETNCHLGGDFFLDKDRMMCCGTQTHMRHFINAHKESCGEQPKEAHAPLDKNGKPESEDTPHLGLMASNVSKCQFDVAHTVMSLGHFCMAPSEEHLEQLKHVIGCVKKCLHCAIGFHTGIPNGKEPFGDNPVHHDLMETVHGSVQEEIDANAPPPESKPVHLSLFADTDLMHDTVARRSTSGVLEPLNQMPIDWFSEQQGEVETATCGSKFMAARQAAEHVIDSCHVLCSFWCSPQWSIMDVWQKLD